MTTPIRNKLVRIAYLSNILSWIVLILHAAYTLWAIGMEIQTGSFSLRTTPFSLFPFLLSIVNGLTLFLILQAISVGGSILLGTKERIQ
jgi:hypothetical protein